MVLIPLLSNLVVNWILDIRLSHMIQIQASLEIRFHLVVSYFLVDQWCRWILGILVSQMK